MTVAAPPSPRAKRRRPPGPDDQATAYARAVIAGEVVAGKLVRLACQRHLRDLETAGERGFWWDTAAVDRGIQFFSVLRLPDGAAAGRPFILQPWQAFVVGSLLGWKRSDGKRRFRYAFIEVARANGKTPLAAGLALYALTVDGEQGAQVYSAATMRDQAKIAFDDGVRMAEQTPRLWSRLTKTVNNLAYLEGGSYFRPLAAESKTLDGLRVHFAAVDELHEHPDGMVLAKLRTGMKSSQPILFMITTAGYDRTSACWEEHDIAAKVAEGIIENDTLFAYIATTDDGDDWTDEAVWVKANPNLGISVRWDTLREEYALARQVPGHQNSFKRLRLNLWTEQNSRWLDMGVWDDQPPPRGIPELQGAVCYAGLDLSSTTDLTALVLAFRDEDGSYDLLPYFWLPEARLRERIERDRVPYDQWAAAGLLTLTPGNVVDYDAVRAHISELGAQYRISELAKDRWNSTQIGSQLIEDGLEVLDFGQGFASMTAPTKEFERLLLDRKLRHGGHPVLRWMAANVAVAQDAAGNLKPAKDKATGRIDGIVAGIMAVGRAMLSDERPSVYEERDVMLL